MALLQQNHATVVNHITSTVPSTSRAGFSNHFVSNFISRSQSWILDSGATNHVCCSLSHFFFYKSITPINVKLPNGSCVLASYYGIIQFSNDLILTDVLYIPDFTFNLIIITKVTKYLPYQLTFSHNLCLIQERHSLRTIGSTEVRDGLYMLNSSCKFSVPCSLVNNVVVTVGNAWHFRLGPLSHEKLGILCKNHPYISHSNNKDCTVCLLAKQKRFPFVDSNTETVSAFDIVHMHIWGPLSISSIHGHRYFLTVVDDYSKVVWIYLMKHKSDVSSMVKSFILMVATQFNAKVKIIRSNNGPEFALKDFFATQGIIHQTSCIETPQQNGVVECKHQQILNVTRALLFQSNLPNLFWNFAVSHAVHIMNGIPNSSLHMLSPFECLFGTKPNFTSVKIFGCKAFASTLMANRKKLDPRARECVYLGVKPSTILFDINTREIFVSLMFVFMNLPSRLCNYPFLLMPLNPFFLPLPLHIMIAFSHKFHPLMYMIMILLHHFRILCRYRCHNHISGTLLGLTGL